MYASYSYPQSGNVAHSMAMTEAPPGAGNAAIAFHNMSKAFSTVEASAAALYTPVYPHYTCPGGVPHNMANQQSPSPDSAASHFAFHTMNKALNSVDLANAMRGAWPSSHTVTDLLAG